MKKFLSILVCLILCTSVLAGCGSQKVEEETTVIENDTAVVGTWSENDFDSGFTFNEDGTGREIFWDLTFTYTAVDGLITVKYDDESYGIDKYKYTVNESSITMTRTSGEEKSFTYNKK